MKKLVLKLSLIIVPFGVIILLTNCIVDPANLLSTGKLENEIATILAHGKNVDNISNYDERLLQEEYIKQVKPFEIVILGSSRIMEITSPFYQNIRIANLGVSHANIFDLVAITGVLDSLGKLPKTVFINVDNGLLEEGGTIEWQSLGDFVTFFDYKYLGLNIHVNTDLLIWKKYYTLITFDYFKESLSFIWNSKSKKIVDCGTNLPQNNGRLADGSVFYNEKYRNPNLELIKNGAISTAKTKHINWIDAQKLLLLEKLVKFYQSKNMRIILLKIPYHPDYFQMANSEQGNILLKYETFFDEFAQKNNISIYGSLNPNNVGIPSKDFYDLYHCSGESINKNILIHISK